MAKTLEVLAPRGFTADNAIACVSVCRDELCTPLQLAVRETWGEAFNMSSLAGVPMCGTTAFGAAHAHSPTDDNKERYVYIAMAHIGIGPPAARSANARASVARASPRRAVPWRPCSASWTLVRRSSRNDPDDMEQSLLRHRLLQRLQWGAKPDLVELTQRVRQEALDSLERMIALTVDVKEADYALFNGIQIHGAEGRTFVWPATSYVVVDGVRSELQL